MVHKIELFSLMIGLGQSHSNKKNFVARKIYFLDATLDTMMKKIRYF